MANMGAFQCETPGEVFKQGKGHCRGYPVNEATMNGMAKNVKGINSFTSIARLSGRPNFIPYTRQAATAGIPTYRLLPPAEVCKSRFSSETLR